jgi:opacity protein-like surface antigen
MNIKSLLLGSAAALVAVSGARAADAVVVAEPEPVEYVRVCDVYGTSFYYIPGTEICLKVGGYVRYDLGAGDLFGDVGDDSDDGDNDTWHKRGRFQLRVDARTETELGTLRGYAAVDFDWTTSDATLSAVDTNGDGLINDYDGHNASNSESIEHAYVELGGFRIGVTDSYFVTFTGYASGVVNDGLINYGPFTTHQIAYTFDAGNGFSIGGAVEEGSDGENFGATINDYAPHAVLGVAYKTGIFGISAVGGYDSNEEEFSAKGRVDVTPNDMFSFFVMGAWTDDDDGSGGNYYAQWGGEWAIWAGAAVNVNERITLNGEFGYNDFGDYSFDADVNVVVVPGFVVTPGIGYRHGDGDINSPYPDGDNWGGYLRTQFTF